MNYLFDGRRVTLVSATPNTVKAHPAGGGFELRIPKLLWDSTAVEDEARPVWRKILVTSDGWEGKPLEAWTDGTKWNGWEVPWFERDEALRIANEDGSGIAALVSGSTLYPTFALMGELGEPECWSRPTTIDMNGVSRTVWNLFDGWCWDEERVPEYMRKEITTVAGAAEFILELYRDGKLFHFDDSPETIIRHRDKSPAFTKDECEALKWRVSDLFEVLGDPFRIAADLAQGRRYKAHSAGAESLATMDLNDLVLGNWITYDDVYEVASLGEGGRFPVRTPHGVSAVIQAPDNDGNHVVSCPACGEYNTTAAEFWSAYANRNDRLTAQLVEYQCNTCGMSFWMGG